MRTESCAQRRAPVVGRRRAADRRPGVVVTAEVLALWPTLPDALTAAGLVVAAAPGSRPDLPVRRTVVLARRDAAGAGSALAGTVLPAGTVCVVPSGDPRRYADALDAGAAGVVPEDAPVAAVVDVVHAALRGQVLLPVDVLRDWVSRALGHGTGAG